MNQDTQRPQFPPIPSSLNAGDHEMRDYNTPEQARPNTVSRYTPYLGLPSRLSQIWLNRWTILLVLVIARLLLSTQDLNRDLVNAKTEALSACTSVENVGSAVASMPYYLSDGVNTLAADGVNKAVGELMSTLSLGVTVVEQIVLFYINMLTSTYVSLITLVVGGSLQTAILVAEDVAKFVNGSIATITGGISSEVSSFQSELSSFLATVNVASSGLDSTSKPTLNITSQLDSLQNITIDPSNFDAELTKLNGSIPTFADVQNLTNNAITLPFQALQKLINESATNYTFDKSVFPVAQKQALTFCSDNPDLDNFFNGVNNAADKAKTTFLAVLMVAAILACIPMAYLAVRSYKTTQQRAKAIDTNAYDTMDVIYISSRPYTASTGLWLSDRFSRQKARILARWFFAYITTLPVLFVLAVAVAGLISALFQYTILKAVEKEVPVLLSEVGDFADEVVKALDTASTAWADGANGVINSSNAQINNEVFGWVNTSATTLNNTLNTFTTEMISALNTTFGDTSLYQPILGLYDCLLGLKIAGLESATTWIQQNAQIELPSFPDNVFSLGAAASIAPNASASDSFLSSGNSSTNGISSAIVKVTTKLNDGVRHEAIVSACLLGVWVVVVLMGVARVVYAMLSNDRTRAEGGNVGYVNNNPPFPPPPPAMSPSSNIISRTAPAVPYATRPATVSQAPTVFPMSSSRHQTELYSYPPVPEYQPEEKIAGTGTVQSRAVNEPVPGYMRESEYGVYGSAEDEDGWPVDVKGVL